jgi:signal transduction histidine kinase
VVSALAVYAPVVVIGGADPERELAALVAAGSADFVSRAGGCLPVALGFVEQRLRQAKHAPAAALRAVPNGHANAGEAFGETLRHELNNPLTGILGIAELLLAELRRKNDGRLPNGGQQRLETIAALAVRLRETVRRLSEDWQAQHHPAH